MNAVCVLLLFVSFGVIGQAFVFPHPSVDSSYIHKRGRTSFAKVEPSKVTLFDSSSGSQGGTPPDLDREQLAVDFFSHPYFYDGDIGDAQAASATRACKFESKKVKEVLALFEKDKNTSFYLASKLQKFYLTLLCRRWRSALKSRLCVSPIKMKSSW
jgi:hypothetical protein